jgi:hypothetical protein
VTTHVGSGRFALEQPGPLSQSLVWGIQRNAYESRGPEGWSPGEVPDYATTNPYFVSAYAAVLLGYLRDCQQRADFDPTEPVHIVEVGAGPGRFGFRLVTELLERRARSRVRDVPIRYVLTDLAEANVAFWRSHPRMVPLIEAGIVDVARFDLVDDEAIELQISGGALGPGLGTNPGAVVANYIFDSIPQDLFLVTGGEVVARHAVATAQEPAPDFGDPGLMRTIVMEWEDAPLDRSSLDEPTLAIVDGYARDLDEGTTLLLPTVAIRAIDRMARWWDDRMLLLSADKAFASEEEQLTQEAPEVEYHGGAFSMMVDFRTIGAWFRQRGGASLLLDRPSRLNVSASLLGFDEEAITETAGAFHFAVHENDPVDFYSTVLEGAKHDVDISRFLALVRLAGGDSVVFLTHLPMVGDSIRDIDVDGRRELDRVLHLVWDRYYPVSETMDLAYYLSYAFHELGDLPTAIEMLHHSLEIHGPTGWTLYNLAQCLQEMGDLDAAEEVARRAREHDEAREEATAMLTAIAEARGSS